MTWRNSMRKRCSAVVVAVAVCGLVPTGSVWADEPSEPVTNSPADTDEPAPDTGEVDGTTVAVGAPPVPPVNDVPQVAVGAPPVPQVTDTPQVAVGQPPVPQVTDTPQVAVGQPPVPSVTDTPQVAVGRPPVPPTALLDTVGAALDLVADCL